MWQLLLLGKAVRALFQVAGDDRFIAANIPSSDWETPRPCLSHARQSKVKLSLFSGSLQYKYKYSSYIVLHLQVYAFRDFSTVFVFISQSIKIVFYCILSIYPHIMQFLTFIYIFFIFQLLPQGEGACYLPPLKF